MSFDVNTTELDDDSSVGQKTVSIREDVAAEMAARITKSQTMRVTALQPRVNLYVCAACGFRLHTLETAEGNVQTTLPCLSTDQSRILLTDGTKAHHCGGIMMSAFHAVEPDEYKLEEIGYEWRSCTLDQYKEFQKKHQVFADHVAKGGLVLHRRNNKNAPYITHGKFYMRPDGTRLSDQEAAVRMKDLAILVEHLRMQKQKINRKAHSRQMERNKAKAKRRR